MRWLVPLAFMGELAPWLGPLIALAALLYAVSTNRNTKFEKIFAECKEGLSSLKKELDGKADGTVAQTAIGRADMLEDRTSRIETELKFMPDQASQHRVELSVAEMRSDIRALAERVEQIVRAIERFHGKDAAE